MKNPLSMVRGKLKKKHIVGLLVLVLTVLLVYALRGQFISPLTLDLNQGGDSTDEVAASKGAVSQYFELDENVVSVALLVTNSGEEAQIKAGVYDADTDELLAESSAVVSDTEGEQSVNFDIQTDSITKQGTKLYLKLDCTSEGVNYCVQTGEFEQPFYQNGTEGEYQLRMAVTYGFLFHKVFWALFLMVCVVTVLICFSAGKKYGSLQNMFVIIAATAGIAFAFIGPAVQECDGWDHFVRSLDVSYGNVLGSFVNLTHGDNEILIPANLSEFGYKLIPASSGQATGFNDNLQHCYFSEETTTLEYTGGVTSVFYWPQGFGIWLGRVLGLSMYGVVVLSRLCNLLAYIVVTYFAIRLMPMFRNAFTLIALLPLTLYQAASDSPDALLNAFCFLFIALCFHYTYDEDVKLTWKHALGLGLLLTCIFMCKYVYICIGLLVFMIPKERFRSKRAYWVSFGAAMLPLVIIGGVLTVKMLHSVGTIQATEGDMTQLQYISQNPKILVKALLNTANSYFTYYVYLLNTLGSASYPLNCLVPLVPGFIVGVGCLDVNETARGMKNSHKWLCFFSFALSIVGLFVALYIGDGRINPVGADMILGGQGRYFIAVMILAIAALASRKVENHIEYFSTKVVGAMSIMLCYALLTLVMICY